MALLKDQLNFLEQEEIVGEISRSCRFREGFALTQGRRTYMEDFIRVKGCFGLRSDTDLYCIFDGHDGHEAAEFATQNFPDILWDQLVDVGNIDDHQIDKCVDNLGVECCDGHSTSEQKRVAIALHRSFRVISERLEGKSGGTTALVALLLGDDLFVANVGDTRSVLSCKKGKSIRVSTDHRPTDSEKERIEGMGGNIQDMSVPRVNGILAISRALGDHDLASNGVICRPHIKFVPNFREGHRYLIMASDGLWDHVKEGDALKTVNDVLGYKVAAWRPRRRGGDNDSSSSFSNSSSSASSSSTSSSASPFAHSSPSFDSFGSCGQLVQSAPPPWGNSSPAPSAAPLSASVDFQKEEGLFDLDFDDDFGREEEGDDELVGSTGRSGGENGTIDYARLWEKLGMTPSTPSPPPQKDGREGEFQAEKEMSASKKLVELAFHQGYSHDNISVIVVNFAEI